jgi:thiol:disulfide interchange protein
LSGPAPVYSCVSVTRSPPKTTLNRLAGFVAALCSLALGLSAVQAGAAPVSTGHVSVELVAETAGVAPGGTVHVALRQQIAPGWHTYWRNPGDSGEATTLAWTLPAGWRAGDIVWAAPKKLPIGPLMDYGYEGEVLLPAAVSAPASAAPGQTVQLKARADYLVCKDICVPEGADLTLSMPVTSGPPPADPSWAKPIADALAAAPRPAGLNAALTPGASLKLSITGAAVRGGQFPDAYFYPYDSTVIDHAQPQTIDRGPDGLTLTLAPGSAFKTGKAPASVAGLLSFGGKTAEISATVGSPLAGAGGLGAPAKPLSPSAQLSAVLLALISAFIGGLILNLMPCVFPILSMKVIALARHAHGQSLAAQGLAFMGGVVATFLLLAGALIGARAAGQAVGWGFQLQSPAVVGVLALVMLLAALNLSGVFEIGERLQSLAGEAGGADKGGLAGSALTGALAVAVAAPCTAPFMAGAIGFALTQGPVVALAIFLALGLGLAAPFTALSFAPGLLRLLPRPGAWMATLKSVLAFPMYGAAAWLVWVFSQQAGTLGLAALLAAAVLAGFAGWLYGEAQRAGMTGERPWARLSLAGVSIALAGALALTAKSAPAAVGGAQVQAGAIPAQPFSPDKLAALRAAGKPVFVNLTAAWCVTCQVNERVALSNSAVADAFRKDGVTYLVGDWTSRDAVIAQTLAEHGRAGVPLYLMYGAGGGEPVVLPQILTPGIVLEAEKKAAKV